MPVVTPTEEPLLSWGFASSGSVPYRLSQRFHASNPLTLYTLLTEVSRSGVLGLASDKIGLAYERSSNPPDVFRHLTYPRRSINF